MNFIVKILNTFFTLILLTTLACSMGESSIDEDFQPGVPIKRAATLEISGTASRGAIDLGTSYDFGRQLIYNETEVSFSVTNTGERIATQISSNTISSPFSYKGGSYPGTGGTCSTQLEAKASCTISILYLPISVQSHSTQFVLTYHNGRVAAAIQTAAKDFVGEGYSLSPVISSVTPATGPASGGTTLTIIGKYFRTGLSISLGGSACTIISINSLGNQVTCSTSAHSAGGVSLTATNEFSQTTTTGTEFTYIAAPTVTSVSPSSGSTASGDLITITGTGFISGATVTVDGNTCTTPSILSSTSITCTTPSGSLGAVDIVVTNSDSQSGTGTGVFSYITTVGSWTATGTTGAPSIRAFHSSVWTGSKMIIFGGGDSSSLNTGAQYDPITDSWTATTTSAPPGRHSHGSIWTGSKMLIFHGSTGGVGHTNTGGQYDPQTDTWSAITTTGTPSGRYSYSVVWTGSKALIFGGKTNPSTFNTGGQYDPQTNTWSTITTSGAPTARYDHSAVWTGSKMLVFGDQNNNSGGQYDPQANSWTAITTTGAPSERSLYIAVWTGSKALIFGGGGFTLYNDGGLFDPQANSWSAITTTGAPSIRYRHSAVWTGSTMIAFGGEYTTALNDGGQYDPQANSWTTITNLSAPSARKNHSAIWTGSKMIVFAGNTTVASRINTGGIYTPPQDSAANTWITMTTTGAPSIREAHSAVWTGSKMIVFGGLGLGGSLYVNTGGQYDPISNSWTTTNTTTAPSIRATHTAVWTGSKMLVFGGTIGSGVGFNTGALYDPSANTWSVMESTTAPSRRFNHTAIWTGSKMIIFGGFDFNVTSIYLNTGGQYDPSNNTWTATETLGAPSVRERHPAVWTGSKMIVFGGWENSSVNTGGQYNPSNNTWTATETTNAPSIRHWHSAVWTGSKMIVFGGGGGAAVNTGGLYDSNANTWSATNITGAPSARAYHTAVWTGSKMIIFGGNNGDSTGGQFDPSYNTWVATTITGAPQARTQHTAVWTDSKMIIFGGAPYMNTGGGYTP